MIVQPFAVYTTTFAVGVYANIKVVETQPVPRSNFALTPPWHTGA